MDDALDTLPLELLLALRDAVADPSEAGRERAALRAKGAGIYLHCTNEPAPDPRPPRVDPTPIAMEAAPEGVEALTLRFET